MTPYHVVVIVGALIVPVVCGLHGNCQPALHDIIDICKLAIVGTLGNALGFHAAKKPNE